MCIQGKIYDTRYVFVMENEPNDGVIKHTGIGVVAPAARILLCAFS